MDVVVTGIGLQSCLGNLQQSWSRLLAGKSGIKICQPFAELPPYPLGLISGKSTSKSTTSPSKLDELTKVIVKSAITDAGLNTPLAECGVVIGSSRGCQHIWESFDFSLTHPLSTQGLDNWLNTLPDQASVTTARLIQTQAPVLSPMAACATGIQTIARGYELIQTGTCQRVIAGAVETPITKLSLAGFERMGALAKSGCYPFDQNREGLVLAEGGAIFVLESAELALRRRAKIYGKISGFGLTCDATSLIAPDPNHKTAAIAIKNCLARSNLLPQDIDYIHTHGTSTKLNDSNEASLIEYLFPNSVAVSSTKGATGHTLGASGALGIAWCLMAIRKQQLPPCVGLIKAEFPLKFVKRSQQAKVNNTLCFSFGFGGQNAILAVSKFAD
ncbi:MAG: beta-ketoacyl-ACP synthase [Cyanobacteria bacterium J06642_3]